MDGEGLMEFKSGQVVKLKVRYRNEHAYFWNSETNDFVWQNHHRHPELYPTPEGTGQQEVARYVRNDEVGIFIKTVIVEEPSNWYGPKWVDVVLIGEQIVAFEHRRIRRSSPRKYESKIKRITVMDHRREE